MAARAARDIGRAQGRRFGWVGLQGDLNVASHQETPQEDAQAQAPQASQEDAAPAAQPL